MPAATPAEPVAPTQAAAPGEPVAAPQLAPKPDPATDPAPMPVLEPPATDDPVVVESPVELAPGEAPANTSPGDDAIDGFFDLLTRFLNGIDEGFESREGSFRFFYSQSFKLEILKSVITFEAPADSGNAADTAGALIDSVAESADD